MSDSITTLKGVGNALAAQFAKLGIHTITDLLFHLPRDYEDRSRVRSIRSIQIGQSALFEGIVTHVEQPIQRKTLVISFREGNYNFHIRFFRTYPGLAQKFKIGTTYRLFGEVRYGPLGRELHHPESMIKQDDTTALSPELTPIYPLTEGLSQHRMRSIMRLAFEHFPRNLTDLLPDLSIRFGYELPSALRYIHTPPIDADTELLLSRRHPTQLRLILEELAAHQLSLLLRRQFMRLKLAQPFATPTPLANALLKQLPFSPTAAQRRVINDISHDLTQPYCMLRLLQGDVGSGKTLVAAFASCQILQHGWQVALMAPTEILSEQLAYNLQMWLGPLGIRTELLTSKLNAKTKTQLLEDIQAGSAQLIIGTHALFQDQVIFSRLGLVIIDEQHRFGVAQRLSLVDRKQLLTDTQPHQLIMTATPIPRTLTMSVYGDLDTSVIDELPAGRMPITTVTLPSNKRQTLMERIKHHCSLGHQAYWVCTLVEESEHLEASAAQTVAEELTLALSNLRVGLVHGRLKSVDKNAVMQSFKAGELDVLVATTVIEVGVDVPRASLMIIENAERLGLSQLHQIRGRVGRGSAQSYCVLLYNTPLSETAHSRLHTLRDTQDGFAIAEADLALRGPGELLGVRQSGDMSFRLAHIGHDHHLIGQARELAQHIFTHQLNLAPLLLARWCPAAAQFLSV